MSDHSKDSGQTTAETTVDEFEFPSQNGHVPGFRNLSEFVSRRVVWLDKPFWQQNCFELVAGRKGVCKGTYLSGLAARCTRGLLYETPKRVLWFGTEDSTEIDVRPRIIAAGGDDVMFEVPDEGRVLRIPRDLGWLESSASMFGDVGLIVLDPIADYVGGVDTNTEEVRQAIGPLNGLADRLGCVIVGVRHLNKDVSRGALSSVMGGSAWVNVPRAVILMAADDEDEWTFHMQVVAGNRGPVKGSARELRMEIVAEVEDARDITRVIELGMSEKDVEQLLCHQPKTEKAPSRSAEARAMMLDILDAEGEQESDTLEARIAAETGLRVQTIRNLRTDLRNEGLTRARKDGGSGKWFVGRTNAPRYQGKLPTSEPGSKVPDEFDGLF